MFYIASPGLSCFKLQGYSGFDPMLCYGDILLSYEWVSSRPSQQNIDSSKKGAEETVKVQPVLFGDSAVKKPHDFIRTHFHRATHCDFCTKKVFTIFQFNYYLKFLVNSFRCIGLQFNKI